ncbi:MAG: thiazole biosynthesis adenylyltransferase ThiF [Turicibacter sp.]|nr:thiazole biosynthesis adenylyltransferase ThiF [Turicibacter sp.]
MAGRYSRQELFPKIGPKGQQSLSEKHVLIIGAGALGTGNAEALVRAGVGKLTIVDRDYVELSNLGRQQLYSESDAMNRLPKAIAAKNRLQAINSEVEINALVMDVVAREINTLVEGTDLLMDATDNFEVRMLINDVAAKHGIPWIYGACVGSYGMSYPIIPGKTPCLSCLMGSVPIGGATCDTAGIIMPAVQMVTAYQVAEALKILVGDWEAVRPTLVSFDLWENRHQSLNVSSLKKSNCTSCGVDANYPFLKFENETKTLALCGRDTVQVRPAAQRPISLKELKRTLGEQGIGFTENPYLMSFEAESHRLVVFNDGRALVHGTKDEIVAKSLYQKYLG